MAKIVQSGSRRRRENDSRKSETEDFLEPVDPGWAPDHPACGSDGAFGVDGAARCPMHELEALPGTGKDHVVVADRIAAA